MAMKDITDKQVLEAVREAQAVRDAETCLWPYELLVKWTGQPEKVCFRCMERAVGRGYLDYGVSLRTAWITDKGKKLILEG